MPNAKSPWTQILSVAIAVLIFGLSVSSRLFASASDVTSLQTSREADEKQMEIMQAEIKTISDGVSSANAKLDLLTKQSSK